LASFECSNNFFLFFYCMINICFPGCIL